MNPYDQQPYQPQRRPPSKYLALWITLPVIAAFLVCGGIAAALDNDDEEPAPPQQAVAATPSPTPPASPSPASSPSPTDNPTAYLGALRTIGPDLIRGNEERAVDWGRSLCGDIRGGLAQAQHASRAATRYSGGNVRVTEAQGAKIVAAAVQHLCPDAAAAAAPPATRTTTTAPANPPGGGTTDEPADVYYKNCDAVKAAGKAPLYRGQPGYRSGLDRDNDGVACET